ncbi:MAG: bis(5'-nucleosyl)-tetraphosphatase (symmetrical) YqeK [Ruminococcus sp.]
MEANMAMCDVKTMQAFLKERLSRERYTHTMNVAKECGRLAKLYGEDPDRAYFAGMVHDICKEDPREQQYEWAVKSGMDFCKEEAESWKVWHGVAGAYFLKEKFGITDEDILRAVRFHTIGRAGMSVLEKIVYLGDMTSAERNYSGVDIMRKACMQSLDKGMLYALRYSVKKQLKRCAVIPHFTLEAYNEYTLMFPEDTYHI